MNIQTIQQILQQFIPIGLRVLAVLLAIPLLIIAIGFACGIFTAIKNIIIVFIEANQLKQE